MVEAILSKHYSNYWTRTETFEALKVYIQLNYDGLKESVVQMLAGKHLTINTRSFQNDMMTFDNKDGVLTLLLHLGYLAFDQKKVRFLFLIKKFRTSLKQRSEAVNGKSKPALIVELKYNKTASGAIEQIRKKKYAEALSEYEGNMLLVGIDYNRESKEHECRIEKFYKE